MNTGKRYGFLWGLLLVFLLIPHNDAWTVNGAHDSKSGDYPVTAYGAIGDGITLNTAFIQEAIDQCAGDGGGRVVIGPGRFLSGTLVMRDHVELHVTRGAVLLGSTNPDDYPEMVTGYRFYGDEWVRQSLIFGANLKSTSPRACENITISNCIISSHCNAIKLGTESVGGFKNISITNCVIKPSSRKEVIYGLPQGISGISMELAGGIGESDPAREVPELEDQYPESTMFGLLPASLLYMRHVKDISMAEINVSFLESDKRNHLVTEDVTGLDYSRINIANSEEIRVLKK